MDRIVGFLQQNSEASASWECGVLQPGPMGKTYTATGTRSCDLSWSCFKRLTAGSNSNYSALLLVGRKFVRLFRRRL